MSQTGRSSHCPQMYRSHVVSPVSTCQPCFRNRPFKDRPLYMRKITSARLQYFIISLGIHIIYHDHIHILTSDVFVRFILLTKFNVFFQPLDFPLYQIIVGTFHPINLQFLIQLLLKFFDKLFLPTFTSDISHSSPLPQNLLHSASSC